MISVVKKDKRLQLLVLAIIRNIDDWGQKQDLKLRLDKKVSDSDKQKLLLVRKELTKEIKQVINKTLKEKEL